jgi:hypothetical protein
MMKTESVALVMIKWAMNMARSERELRSFVDVECNKKAISVLNDDERSDARKAYAAARDKLRGKR